MSNLVLPVLPGMTFPVVKSPNWRTIVQGASSGAETRIGLWSFPLWDWTLTYDFLRNDPANAHDELYTLLGFYNQVRGSYDSWLFSDPDDSSVTTQSFGTGNGSLTQFQLARTRGGFVEPVTNLSGAPTILVNGDVQSSGYSVSATGLVTFTSPPANGAALTWTGSFYWRCRFKEDSISPSKFVSLVWELSKLEFVSVK
jgi:uncharacterized protein (TIGR02217 family)